MKLKRIIVVAAILSLLGVGICTPAPAHADTTDNFIYAGIAVAVYVGLVFTATKLIYGETDHGLPSVQIDGDLPSEDEPATVRFGQRCAQQGGNLTLVCW